MLAVTVAAVAAVVTVVDSVVVVAVLDFSVVFNVAIVKAIAVGDDVVLSKLVSVAFLLKLLWLLLQWW